MTTLTKTSRSIEAMLSTSSCPSLLSLGHLQIGNASFLAEETFPPKKTFNERLVERIETVRGALRERVRNWWSQKQNLPKKVQKELLGKITDQINILQQPVSFLLSQGILNLFLGLLDIQQRIRGYQNADKLEQALKGIIRESSTLLKDYFIYQEYSARKPGISPIQQSPKTLNQQVNTLITSQHGYSNIPLGNDYNLLNQIQTQMSGLTINQIITNYMQKQIAVIPQKEEVCRICSVKVKLEKIQPHLKLCQKISNLKEQLQEKNSQQQALINDVKSLLKELNRQNKSQKGQSLKKIIGMLLMEEKAKRQKGIRNRSNSNGVWSSDRQITPKWEFYLDEHEILFGQHFTLKEIVRVQRSKMLIEKNLICLQEAVTSETSKFYKSQFALKLQDLLERSSKSLHQSQSSLQRELAFSRKLIQLQAKDQVISNSGNSYEDELNPKMPSWQCFDQKLKTIRSRRILYKQSDIVDSYSKGYVSLQHIPSAIYENRLSLQNFEILKALGQGAYGKVYMARRKETKDIYALKIIKLSENSCEKDFQTIKTEHEIFKKIGGDHLVKAPFSFSERGSHIFVLQFMPGGDLRKLLDDQVYFEEEAAQFYLAQIIVAIQYLHKHEIIHRDLKPENLVIDQYGHLKLTDFGLSAITIKKRLRNSLLLCKESTEIVRTNKRRAILRMQNIHQANIIGTPDYIAPEIINHTSTNNKSIDWWSLGVIAYQLLIGARPFAGDTIEEVIQNIRDFNIEWPEIGHQEGMISAEAKDLIEKLLNKDIMSRLGADGAEDIKAHPFFRAVNWDNIKNQTPPFIPNMKQTKDFAYCSEDQGLREELENKLGVRPQQLKGLRLERFVRYDLLGSETLQNFSKIYNQQTTKLKKLGTCRGFDLETTIR